MSRGGEQQTRPGRRARAATMEDSVGSTTEQKWSSASSMGEQKSDSQGSTARGRDGAPSAERRERGAERGRAGVLEKSVRAARLESELGEEEETRQRGALARVEDRGSG
jgi:hypothetical protein